MTIKDITPRGTGFPNVGVVRLGIMVGDGESQHPKDVDYFVIDGEYGKNAPDLVSAYTETPKELLIWLVHPTWSEAFRTSYTLFGNSGKQCQGDGETIQFLVDPNGISTVIRDGVVVQDYNDTMDGRAESFLRGQTARCPGREAPDNALYPRCRKCGQKGLNGILTFVVRDPNNPTQPIDGRMVTYRLTTGSWRSTMNLIEQLQAAESMARHAGRDLFMLPMRLRRVPGHISVPSKNKKGEDIRAQVEKAFLQVEIEPSAVAMMVNGPRMAPALGPGSSDNGKLSIGLPSGAAVFDVATGEIIPVDEIPVAEDGEYDDRPNPPQFEDPRFADINAMRDDIPENWKEFHHRLQAAWGDGYLPGQVNQAVSEALEIGRPPSDPTPAFWNGAIDVLIAHLKDG